MTPPVLTRESGAVESSIVAPPGIGTVLAGRYRLEAMLERGGMNLVYRAADLRRAGHGTDARRVAVKLVNPDFSGRGARRALKREASILAELGHPGIVRMLGLDYDGGSGFMVMELLEGQRLRSHPTPLPAEEAMRITRAVAEILAYLHAQGLVHRDVKPANIFLTASGEVKLLDFGLAAWVGGVDEPGIAAPPALTPLYASAEMLAGAPPDPRDDVYSLGCTVYEMLTGRHPWGNRGADEAARRKLTAARPAGLSRPRWKVLRKALALKAANRPADAAAFLAAFFPARPSRWLMPWAAAALLVSVAVGVLLTNREPEVPGRPAEESREAPAVVEAPQPGASPAIPRDPERISAPEPAPVEDDLAEGVSDSEIESEDPAEDMLSDRGAAPEESAAPTPETAPPPASQPAPRGAPAPRTMALAAERFRIAEGGGALRLELRRPAGYVGPLGVLWRTVDQTAREGVDFIGSPAWQWAGASATEQSVIIFIPIVDDSIAGPDVTFLIELQQVTGGPTVGQPDRAEVTIVDDD